jgi:membrane AbrB-like protein
VAAAGVLAIAVALEALSVPSAFLLAGLLVGAGLRAGKRWAPQRSPLTGHAAQAVVGAAAAIGVEPATVGAIADHWAPLVAVCAVTLGLSVAMGAALGRLTGLDLTTASLAMIAGGASGVVSMSGDLGADDRVVAVIQYLRVVLAVALTPLIAAQLFGAGAAEPSAVEGTAATWIAGMPFVAVCGFAGLAIARRVPVAGGELLWPMLVAIALALAGWHVTAAPAGALDAAFALIGLQVGLRFTADVVRRLGAILPAALGLLLALMAACGLLGLALASLARVSALDAYLATTPGGLPAVVAVGMDAGADLTFILSVQILRTIVMLAAAGPVARRISARRTTRAWLEPV